ncbi:hypothetical protein GCM10009608_83920 [Pseudonocardia alaniniphila]
MPRIVSALASIRMIARMLRTKDPEDLAILYLATAFGFFPAGGAMALLMPAKLGRTGTPVPVHGAEQPAVHDARHGHAVAMRHTDPARVRQLPRAPTDNYLVPLQIGAPDVAFSRLNPFSIRPQARLG